MAPINFGVLMIPYQIIDAAGPLDMLSSCTKDSLSLFEGIGFPGTAGISAKGIEIEFHHINETMNPVTLTAAMKVLPTTTCDDCPPLDFLLIGGPNPNNFQLSERFTEFVRAHAKAGKGIFTTCTGAFAIASSGVLDGKTVTTNHAFLPRSRSMYPNVKWVEEQWVVDGNIWTAGGACAGMDMMAQWVVEHYGMDVANIGFKSLDFEPRDIDGNRLLPQQHSAASV